MKRNFLDKLLLGNYFGDDGITQEDLVAIRARGLFGIGSSLLRAAGEGKNTLTGIADAMDETERQRLQNQYEINYQTYDEGFVFNVDGKHDPVERAARQEELEEDKRWRQRNPTRARSVQINHLIPHNRGNV